MRRDRFFCDCCGADDYADNNPFVEMRVVRPSDQTDMCCVLAGHWQCVSPLPVETLPRIETTGGIATPEQWEEWIERDGARQGFQWIS